MSKLVTQELAIVVSVRTENPSILSESFLKQTGIIPGDWKLAREPIYTDRAAQIIFENELSIIAQPDRIMFLEAIGNKELVTIVAAQVVQRYVATLKLAEYQAIGINFRGYVPQQSPQAAREYINTGLLNTGNWQDYGDDRVRAAIDLTYKLSDRQLNLSVSDASIQFPEQAVMPIVLFAGSFSYSISTASAVERANSIAKVAGNWQQDLNEYTALINDRFIMREAANKATSSIDSFEIRQAEELPPVLVASN